MEGTPEEKRRRLEELRAKKAAADKAAEDVLEAPKVEDTEDTEVATDPEEENSDGVVASTPKSEVKPRMITMNLKPGKGRGERKGVSKLAHKISKKSSETADRIKALNAKRKMERLEKDDAERSNPGATSSVVETIRERAEEALQKDRELIGRVVSRIKKALSKEEGGEQQTQDTEELTEEIKKELEYVPIIDREVLEKGFNNIGFRIERAKNDFFANTFAKIASKSEKGGFIARLTKSAAASFRKDADSAFKKATAVEESGIKSKFSNVAYIAKNILRPLRLIADATGLSPTGIQRYMMVVGMATSRATGVLKETRFANEELLNQTRIDDVEKATTEAWEIYESAQQREEKSGEKVSAEELKAAYLQKIPQDLQKRLSDTTTANEMTKSLFRKHIEFDVGRLNEDIEDIDALDLSDQEKNSKKEELVRSWEARLVDYDRVLTTVGTVDAWAMSGRYAESVSKNIVRALTVQTLYLSVDKLFEGISHAVAGLGVNDAIEAKLDSINSSSLSEAIDKMQNAPKSDFDFNNPLGVEHTFEPTAVAAAGAEIKSAIVEAKIDIAHGLHGPVNFEIKGSLEHAYEKLVLDHTLPDKLPDGVVVDQDVATRALNEAANLVRLTNGHGVPGISAAEFSEAAKFENGILKIINADKFNDIVDRLHTHSGELMKVGILKNPDGAMGYIGEVDWLDKVRALDMHEVVSTVGHPEATADQIGDFSHMPSAHDLHEEATRSRLLDAFDKMDKTPRVIDPSDIDSSAVDSASQSTEVSPDTKMAPDDFLNENNPTPTETAPDTTFNQSENPATYKPYNQPTNFNEVNEAIGRTLSDSQLTEITNYKLQNIFSENNTFSDVWETQIKDQPADLFMNIGDSTEEGLQKFVVFMHKLRDASELEPRSKGWIRGAESTSKYIARALKEIGERSPEKLREIIEQ